MQIDIRSSPPRKYTIQLGLADRMLYQAARKIHDQDERGPPRILRQDTRESMPTSSSEDFVNGLLRAPPSVHYPQPTFPR